MPAEEPFDRENCDDSARVRDGRDLPDKGVDIRLLSEDLDLDVLGRIGAVAARCHATAVIQKAVS